MDGVNAALSEASENGSEVEPAGAGAAVGLHWSHRGYGDHEYGTAPVPTMQMEVLRH
jgi:hypothetical protein